jgi:hypothetical protein
MYDFYILSSFFTNDICTTVTTAVSTTTAHATAMAARTGMGTTGTITG